VNLDVAHLHLRSPRQTEHAARSTATRTLLFASRMRQWLSLADTPFQAVYSSPFFAFSLRRQRLATPTDRDRVMVSLVCTWCSALYKTRHLSIAPMAIVVSVLPSLSPSPPASPSRFSPHDRLAQTKPLLTAGPLPSRILPSTTHTSAPQASVGPFPTATTSSRAKPSGTSSRLLAPRSWYSCQPAGKEFSM
jgi:hypothetical protein